MPAIVQFVVPLAEPLTPVATFSQTTRVIADDAVPVNVTLESVVEKDVPVVGVQIDTDVVAQPEGAVVPPLVDEVVIVHEKVCDVLKTPSDARAVTLYVPAVVPVPEM
jgi:hypothetical protein